VALELGVPADDVVRRMPTLPAAPHRLEQALGAGGVVVLDDTYNANPAGGRAALAALGRLGADGARRVVVTPGMVELGPRQAEENAGFAAEAAAVATDLVVVGRTNRRALVRGARRPSGGAGDLRIVMVRTRPEATAWVRDQLGNGDVVLYENDLPDHYP
jgi:UDP-N-acetylmuramoyl-tripeptide--D-alanyl-D-alanine ligase